MASKQHAHLMTLVGKMIPPVSGKLHKGQAGALMRPSTETLLELTVWQVGSVF